MGRVLTAGVVLVLLASAGFAAPAAVQVGVLMPLTGPFASGGTAAVQSLQLAERRINTDGGILGRPVRLVIADSQGRADVATQEALRLVQRERVWALIGAYLSEETLPVQEVAAERRVLHIVPIAATVEITERVAADRARFGTTFRVAYHVGQWAELLGEFLAKQRVMRYAFVGANIRWNREFSQALHAFLQPHGATLVYEAFYSPASPQMDPVVLAARQARPEYVVLGDPGRGSIEFVKRARDLDLLTHLLSVGGALGDARVARTLPLGNYLHFQAAAWRGQTPDATRYFALFQKSYGYLPVGYSDTLPYDALVVLAQAASQANSLEVAAVIDALERGTFRGIAGSYRFDRTHQAIWGQRGLRGVIIRWVNGFDEVIGR